jgi:hypothetical protein
MSAAHAAPCSSHIGSELIADVLVLAVPRQVPLEEAGRAGAHFVAGYKRVGLRRADGVVTLVYEPS